MHNIALQFSNVYNNKKHYIELLNSKKNNKDYKKLKWSAIQFTTVHCYRLTIPYTKPLTPSLYCYFKCLDK